MHMHRIGILGRLVLVAASLTLVGCGSDTTLTVSAAASLRDVLPPLIGDARLNVGGSGDLATQLREGAPVDVVVLADSAIVTRLVADGIVDTPVSIATNRLAIIVPADNPAAIARPADLARRGVRLVLANPSVPVGGYARVALARLRLAGALTNIVSNEDSVAGVLAKVRLGEADAGIVYVTDARAAAAAVRTIAIAADAQPSIVYSAAVVSDTRHHADATAIVESITGADGQAALRAAGFGPPPARTPPATG